MSPGGPSSAAPAGVVVDVDDPGTWPDELLRWANAWAARLDDPTRHTNDLAVPLEQEAVVVRLLAGCKVRAFHCTRLLDHEVDWVRQEGLRPLTRELVARRIDAAQAYGHISDAGRDELTATTVYAQERVGRRADQICFILTERQLHEDPGSVADLLSGWGGEALYMGAQVGDPALRSVGRPAIVAAAVDLGSSEEGSHRAPPLSRLLVSVLADGAPRHGDLLLRTGPVPAEDIISVWMPGDSPYDAIAELPRR